MNREIELFEHPLADVRIFTTEFPKTLEESPTPPEILSYFGDRLAPVSTSAETKQEIRNLLRWGGFKPTGRSKPASEYLIKAVEEGWLSPEKGINLAVDICNVVSFHSGIPISVVDVDLALEPWSLRICPEKTSYVFNPTGQDIDVSGLLSFYDAEGPCGGPVKDSQRTKTHDSTRRTLSILWGCKALAEHVEASYRWYITLLESVGASTQVLKEK